MDHPKTCICGGNGRVYDHVQDDTGTECPINYATWTDIYGRVIKQVPVDNADMPEKVEPAADIPGWTKYKFHYSVSPAPGSNANDNVWKTWQKTATEIRQQAWCNGFGVGLATGCLVTIIVLIITHLVTK